VAVLAVGLLVLRALRIRRHCDLEAEATALHPEAIELPASAPFTPQGTANRRSARGTPLRFSTS
jgi:hypothetical protein